MPVRTGRTREGTSTVRGGRRAELRPIGVIVDIKPVLAGPRDF
jgi:hypothetical protein